MSIAVTIFLTPFSISVSNKDSTAKVTMGSECYRSMRKSQKPLAVLTHGRGDVILKFNSAISSATLEILFMALDGIFTSLSTGSIV